MYLRALAFILSCVFLLTACLDLEVDTKPQNTCTVPMPSPSALSQHTLQDTFEIFVWNVYKGKRNGWLQVLDAHARNSDLILLQEAIDKPNLTEWLENTHPHWSQVSAFKLNNATSGVLTGARIAATQSCAFRIPEPFIRIPKSALSTEYPLAKSGQTLLVINIHAINFELGMAAYRKQLQQLFKNLDEHTGPVLFAGDFNSWSPKRIDTLRTLMAQHKMLEATLTQEERTRIFGLPIDHIFYRGLELLDFKALSTKTSDHRPLLAQFRVAL